MLFFREKTCRVLNDADTKGKNLLNSKRTVPSRIQLCELRRLVRWERSSARLSVINRMPYTKRCRRNEAAGVHPLSSKIVRRQASNYLPPRILKGL